MEVERVAEGLWRWVTPHPDWTPETLAADGWDRDVACVYYEAADAIVLVDPLVPSEPAERDRFLRALDRDVERAGRPVAVVLTLFWHERSAGELAGRYDGAAVWAHRRAVDRLAVDVTHPFAAGDPLPGGIDAIDAHRRDEVLLWIPRHAALVVGDVLLGDGAGGVRICPDDWLEGDVSPVELRERLRPLLELPVERILAAHGEPVLADAAAALGRALA